MRTDALNLKIKKVLGENSKKLLVKILFPFRNQFILFNISNRAKKNEVNLNYWDESNNLGDLLSPIIVNYVLSLRNIKLTKKINKKKHLYAVGSVLTAGIQDATVWGSGILNATLLYRLENRQLDIRAVRGPVTRAILKDYGFNCPEIYGDPAILLPLVYTAKIIANNPKPIGIIMHKDYNCNELITKDNCKIVDICTNDYKDFVNQIVGCEKVISSSLHGIIIAESYGIPAVLLKPQIDYLKYYDYYYSTGRLSFPIADTIQEGMHIEPPTVPDLTSLRDDLIKAFPYDLFY